MKSIMILPLALAGVSAAADTIERLQPAALGSCDEHTECQPCTAQDNCAFNRITQECEDKADAHGKWGKWDTQAVELWAMIPEECVTFQHPVVPEDATTDVPTKSPTTSPTVVPEDATTDIPTKSPTNSPTGGSRRWASKTPIMSRLLRDTENAFPAGPEDFRHDEGPEAVRRRQLICGTDERMKLSYTNYYPWNSIVRLEIYWGDIVGSGTGFFISPKVVMTAAHVIDTRVSGKWKLADKVKVCPGYNDGQTPYGCQWAAMLMEPSTYTGFSKNDYAALILPDEYFHEQGTDWFDYDDTLPAEGTDIYNAGYPQELAKSAGPMWLDITSTWRQPQYWELEHKLSVEKGNSGGPIYYISSISERRNVVAIMVAGFCSDEPGKDTWHYHNTGRVIQDDVKVFWEEAISMGENYDPQVPMSNYVGQYHNFYPHSLESASNCPNLGCYSLSSLDECKQMCDRDTDCNVIVHCPGGEGASCEKRSTGANRCCLRNCPDLLENNYDVMLTTKWQGWDNYINKAATSVDTYTWTP